MLALRSTFLAIPVLVLALVISSGCDTGGGEDGEGEEEGEGESAAWIAGDWAGNVRGKDDGEGGANLVETTVEAKFESDKGKTGSFTFTMPQLEKVVVKGTFADFAGKSLLLTIKESNFSTLGMPGNTTDLDYQLTGDSLELSNTRLVLKLIRKDDGADDGEGDDGGAEVDPTGFVDDWECDDKTGRTWLVNLSSDKTFAIKVYDVPRPVLTLDGDYTIEDATVVMVVSDSNQPNYEGQLLKAQLDGGNLNLYRMIRTGNDTSEPGEAFSCSRD